jgi:putrescine aminotransferase
MFSNGGSDAVEGALKIARQYHKLRGQADRFKFISLRQGYHGVHFGGMSVNGNTNFRRAYEPLLPGCFHVDTPWLYHNPYTDDPAAWARSAPSCWSARSSSRAPTRWPPSSPSRSRAPAA